MDWTALVVAGLFECGWPVGLNARWFFVGMIVTGIVGLKLTHVS